jgi:hypothetical protein
MTIIANNVSRITVLQKVLRYYLNPKQFYLIFTAMDDERRQFLGLLLTEFT